MKSLKNCGLTIFDIDETLFHAKANVQVCKDGKITCVLDNQKYNSYKLKKGESFDYTQFKSAKFFKDTSTPITKVIKRAKKIIRFAAQKDQKLSLLLPDKTWMTKDFSKKLLRLKE